MDYFKLMDRFWRLNAQVRFTTSEATLYHFLLAECNRLYWKNPFGYTNGAICASISISEKTLIVARAKLQQHGLLSFKSGHKNCPTEYQLTPSNEPTTLPNTAANFQYKAQPIGQSKPNSLENVRSSLHSDIIGIPQEVVRPHEQTMAKAWNVQASQPLLVASTPTPQVQCEADQSPLVDKEGFIQILRANNYGHVDIETYRQQMLATARAKQVSRPLTAWPKWIIAYLNNERQRGALLTPQALSATTTSPGNLRAKANTQAYVL